MMHIKCYFKLKAKIRGNMLASVENYGWNVEVINIMEKNIVFPCQRVLSIWLPFHNITI